MVFYHSDRDGAGVMNCWEARIVSYQEDTDVISTQLLLCLGEKISMAIELIDGALVVWVSAAPEEHTYSLRNHLSQSHVR